MSSLIFHTEEKQVLVATDTLAVSNDGKPFMFTSKAFIVPHLRMIIAGTGVGGFCGKWFVKINDWMVVRGIDNLDFHAPSNLASLWSDHKKELSIPDSLTSTIYHFGFSEESNLIHSYAYRSTNGFNSEFLPYGQAKKPECNVIPYKLPEDIVKMMDEQRKIQSALPVSDRVYIGGEIQVLHLNMHGFNSYRLHQFEDHDSDEQTIFHNYST